MQTVKHIETAPVSACYSSSLRQDITQLLFRFNRIHALCLQYHSNAEALLFTCFSPGWATTTGRLLGRKMGNSIKCFSQEHSDVPPHREPNQGPENFWLPARHSTNWGAP